MTEKHPTPWHAMRYNHDLTVQYKPVHVFDANGNFVFTPGHDGHAYDLALRIVEAVNAKEST